MLIRSPIFLNCFSRGGSNIFWNLFLSHPEVCSPIRETLEIFRLGWRRPTLAGLRLALLSGQPGFFDQWRLDDRRPLNGRAARFVDRTLHGWKMRTLADPEMRFKREGEAYREEEVRACRLAAKHNNGLTFLVAPLLELYPDATFFNLVRHPLALYESHLRRGITSGPVAFADFYRRLAMRMIVDAETRSCCHLVRFEDILEDPTDAAARVYRLAGLDPAQIGCFRFKSKTHYLADGSYGASAPLNRHVWLKPEEVASFLEPTINQLQQRRVDPRDADQVLDGTGEVRRRLGYEPESVAGASAGA